MSVDPDLADRGRRTIDDFGDQWTRYPDNEGFYGSVDLLADIVGPLLPPSAIEGQRVAEIGSGTGRIVHMLLAAGAARVLAVEPSKAVEVLRRNLAPEAARVDILHASGTQLPAGLDLDLVVSIGVLHHIPDPDPVVAAAYRALRPGGRMLVWLYGKEGNRLVVSIIRLLRSATTRMPHAMLAPLAALGNLVLDVYVPLCRRLRFMPLADYMSNVIGRFSRRKRYLVIYDQLKPAYAKYYTQAEARALLERAGFVDVALHHRRRYSWTVSGCRPAASAMAAPHR
jgi:SAM-dependent methyltransferase